LQKKVGDGEDDDVVPETHVDTAKPIEDLAEVDSGSDFNVSDAEDEFPKKTKKKKPKKWPKIR
jgi:hypothetical protein